MQDLSLLNPLFPKKRGKENYLFSQIRSMVVGLRLGLGCWKKKDGSNGFVSQGGWVLGGHLGFYIDFLRFPFD